MFKVLCIKFGTLVLTSSALANPAQIELKSRLSEMTSFKASFEQQVVDTLGEIVQSSTGKLLLSQPDKMRWEVSFPDETLLVADGDTLWQLDPMLEQVVAMSQGSTVQNNPVVLLTNPESEHWSQFSVTSSITEAGTQFTVDSLATDVQIQSLQLTFNNDVLVALSFTDAQGQNSALTFSDIVHNSQLPVDVFTMSVPEGFELDDQRAQ